MEYLFFDIEASEGESICSFGYVLTDIDFNILEKDDILINPEALFCTSARGKHKDNPKDRGITLAYSKETFLASPVFPLVYQQIRELVERKNTLIVGFSHTNDVRYLCHACRRYDLPFLSYDFFELQDVFRTEFGESNQISLERIVNNFGLNVDDYTYHKSVDDAEISMLAVKKLCENKNCNLEELISVYPRYCGRTENGETSYNGFDKVNSILKKAKNACRGIVTLYASRVCVDKKAVGPLAGKKMCACNKFEKENGKFALRLILALAKNGAKYVSSIAEADYYIKFYENEGEKADKLYNALNNGNLKFTVIEEKELYKMLNTSKEDIEKISNRTIRSLSYRLDKLIKNAEKSVSEPESNNVANNTIKVPEKQISEIQNQQTTTNK